jgi:hypothetical protein
MAQKKRHWLWNILIVLTCIICVLAFALHYKNWTQVEEDRLTIISGFYYTEVLFDDLQEVSMVPKIPELDRVSGFSAWEIEKGIFQDTVLNTNNIRVYIDDLKQEKIKLDRKDASSVYVNFTDSLKTKEMYDFLSATLINKELKSKK